MGVLVAPVCKLWNLLLFCLALAQATPRRLTHGNYSAFAARLHARQGIGIIGESGGTHPAAKSSMIPPTYHPPTTPLRS